MNINMCLAQCITNANISYVDSKKNTELETNNHHIFKRVDYINTEFKKLAEKENLKLIKFNKGIFEIVLLVDNTNKRAYLAYNKTSFNRNINKSTNTKNKNIKNPHYVITLINKLNGNKLGQLTFFPENYKNVLDCTYNNLIKNCNKFIDDCTLYIVLYEIINDQIQDISLNLFGPDLNIIENLSLNKYINPDMPEYEYEYILTNKLKDETDNTSNSGYNKLVKLKTGIKEEIN